jgi:hypothetical protein
MREREWLEHGPASINLLLADLSERDKLQKMCAAIIASVWVKNATLSTFWPEFKEEEEKRKAHRSIRNPERQGYDRPPMPNGNRKLDGKRAK